MNVLPTNADLDSTGIFDAIDFERLKSVIVAVSGGSDSLALLFLLIAFHVSHPRFPEIIAVTVDHGLRPESVGEARYVAELCKEAGISHRILNWSGVKPGTGISAKARHARYSLLCEAARDAGTDLILTGHTRDDQIETFAMRSAREGGSKRGLAGMAPATLLQREIWLVRPLLETSRETLRGYLGAKNITWCDDSSNDDPKYERVRIRKALQDADREFIQREIVVNIALRRSLNMKTALVLPHCVTIHDGICAEIKREDWARQDLDVQRLAIGVLLATMGGLSFLPPAEACDKALQHVASDQPSGRITMSRCVLQLKKDAALVYRERRSLTEITIGPEETAIWDGRFRIRNQTQQPLKIVACGAEGRSLPRQKSASKRHRASTLSNLTMLFNGKFISTLGGPDHTKLPGGITVTRHLALFDLILSGYDESLAQSVADIFQVQGYKRSPVNQINKN
jgi:tRNA(Ile)-lysidine synthase